MSFDPQSITTKGLTLDQARAEVARETQMRAGAYPKFIAAGKLSTDKAVAQLAALMKAQEILDWFARVEGDVRAGMKIVTAAKAHHAKYGGDSPVDEAMTGLALLALVRERPAGLARLLDDPALAVVLDAFPQGQLAAIRRIVNERTAA